MRCSTADLSIASKTESKYWSARMFSAFNIGVWNDDIRKRADPEAESISSATEDLSPWGYLNARIESICTSCSAPTTTSLVESALDLRRSLNVSGVPR